ncbi:hypothetical protein LTR86_011006 [Recurvomyces mirabilis]|nr:hypothetical protein LTR86_011006 [Recurvomyces mirabilis]
MAGAGPLKVGLLQIMSTIGCHQSQERQDRISMTEFCELASYDWLRVAEPTIAVPGEPLAFSPPRFPIRLQPDAMVFAKASDKDTCVQPYKFRLEPLVQACWRSNPDFSLQNVDILSGLNNLRQILKFVSGTVKQPFRIDIQMVGKTMMMTRWERDPNSLTHTSLCRGYGRGFEKTCAKPETKDPESTSHHRIVRYALGDINVVVQYEADLRDCSCQPVEQDHSAVNSPDVSSDSRSVQDQAQLQHQSADLSGLTLKVADIGSPHTRDCLLEIKSRDHKNNNTDDILAQMWLSGCHNLYLARHVRGRFDASGVQHKNVRGDLELWQDQHEQSIAALQSILHTIRKVLQDDPMTSSAKEYALVLEQADGKSVLNLWRRNGGQVMLPDHIMQKLGPTQVLNGRCN